MSTLKQKAEDILDEKERNIIPENIKNGVQIFDVVGTYEGSGGVGTIKEFNSIEDMLEDDTSNEGQKAVVYSASMSGAAVDSQFSSALFPNQVILGTQVEDWIDVSYRAVDRSMWFECWGTLSPSEFVMSCYGDNINIEIYYTSEDGITYNREDGGSETIDFGITIYYSYSDMWDDRIGEFILLPSNSYGGLFEYVNHTSSRLANPVVSVEINSGNIDYEQDEMDISDLLTARDILSKQVSFIDMAFMKCPNNIVKAYCLRYSDYIRCDGFYNVQGVTNGFVFSGYGYSSAPPMYEYVVDISNETVQENELTVYTYPNYMFYTDIILDKPCIVLRGDDVTLSSQLRVTLYNSSISKLAEEYIPFNYGEEIGWVSCKNQFTATKDDVYLEKVFYGKNGVDIGTLGNPNNTFYDVTSKLYTHIQDVYNEMEPIIITENNKDLYIKNNINLIPVKYDGTPLYDLSQLTNATSLFSSCQNLRYIPKLNLDNISNAERMFYYCQNIEVASDISLPNAQTCHSLFSACNKLKIVGNLDLHSATGSTKSSAIFQNANALISVGTIDLSNATDFSYIFSNCSSLVNVPEIIGVNATSITSMFGGCSSLSNDSLNKIMRICINQTGVTSYKTLKNVGLTQAQAQICTTLSNYSDFISAGWTTGY